MLLSQSEPVLPASQGVPLRPCVLGIGNLHPAGVAPMACQQVYTLVTWMLQPCWPTACTRFLLGCVEFFCAPVIFAAAIFLGIHFLMCNVMLKIRLLLKKVMQSLWKLSFTLRNQEFSKSILHQAIVKVAKG